MRRIKHPQIGELVLATKYSDKDPKDPWYIGHVSSVLYYGGGLYYYQLREDITHRKYKCVFRISKEEAGLWFKKHK